MLLASEDIKQKQNERTSLICLMTSEDIKHKILSLCWAGSVPFPPVSLQRQVVCLLLRPVFMCSSQGRACK